MILGTLCPLIIPFLALSSINRIHPVREPVSSSVAVVVMSAADASGSRRHYAILLHSGWEIAAIRSPGR